MANRSFELREFFHLTFLRHLTHRLAGRGYAVKGGICMRFFHRSPRLSEDMDLDVVSKMRVPTLQNSVDTVLNSRAFLSNLLQQGIIELGVSKPKQTDVTQRWKILLKLEGDSLPTKIEFSRRSHDMDYQQGIPNAEVLGKYKSTPFAAQYYNEFHMVEQKIRALSAPSRNAVRDLFDLHHLFYVIGIDLNKAARMSEQKDIEAAIEKVDKFSFDLFRSQVLSYLTEDVMMAYSQVSDFKRLQDETNSKLLEMIR